MGSLMPGWDVDEPGHAPRGLLDEEDVPTSPKSPKSPKMHRRTLSASLVGDGKSDYSRLLDERRAALMHTLGMDLPRKHLVFKTNKHVGDNDDAGSMGALLPGHLRVRIPGSKGGVVTLDADHVDASEERRDELGLDAEMGAGNDIDAHPLSSRDKWWKRLSSSALNDLASAIEEPAHASGNYKTQHLLTGNNPYTHIA